MKKILQLIFLLVFSFSQAQIVINEIKESGSVEFKNLGSSTVDISSYWLCDFPSYTQLSNATITVETGSLNLTAGSIVEISGFNLIDSADGELGLYSSSSFGSSTAIVDYIQWGSGGHTRASVASTAGVWSGTGDFISAFDASKSLQYSGSGNGVNDYFEADDTLGEENFNCTADAGTIAIDIDATGNPNSTTSIATDGLSAVICVDTLADPLVVSHNNPEAINLSYRYIITNEDASEILNITNSSAIDLNGAGTGTCKIWGWSYTGLADNGDSFKGGPLADLRMVDACSDVSTMAITVIREAADAGTIAIDIDNTDDAEGTTIVASESAATIIVGDAIANPIIVSHDNPGATNLSYRYVITNEDASEILNITNSTSIDFEATGVGTCKIWGWSYRGLADNGDSFKGGSLADLRALETCSDVSTMAITVVRELEDGSLSINSFEDSTELNIYPNPTVDLINITSASANSFNVNAQLFNMNGSLLYQKDFELNSVIQPIEMATFSAGVYVLKLTDLDNNISITQKVVKK